ncbi:MAG: nucleoside deaminase [Deltaproteobacteria bacterium]|jgi:tRNA(Arg) A34 adenosine deaminase TadA|nr:nucleoside deaminase [Deltaproteobacteria bacterium]
MPVPPEIAFELMGLALEDALAAAADDEVPCGAVVARADGTVVARGRNRIVASRDPSAHAEMLAIRTAAALEGNYRVPGLILASTLEPCPMCLGAAFHARLAGVVYGAPEPKWGACGSLLNLAGHPLNHRMKVRGGVREEECRKIIRDYFQNKRRRHRTG